MKIKWNRYGILIDSIKYKTSLHKIITTNNKIIKILLKALVNFKTIILEINFKITILVLNFKVKTIFNVKSNLNHINKVNMVQIIILFKMWTKKVITINKRMIQVYLALENIKYIPRDLRKQYQQMIIFSIVE